MSKDIGSDILVFWPNQHILTIVTVFFQSSFDVFLNLIFGAVSVHNCSKLAKNLLWSMSHVFRSLFDYLLNALPLSVNLCGGVAYSGQGAQDSHEGSGFARGLVAHGVAQVDIIITTTITSIVSIILITKVEEGSLFLTPNLTVVEAHVGSSTSLDCTVARDSDHGMVRNHQNNNVDEHR